MCVLRNGTGKHFSCTGTVPPRSEPRTAVALYATKLGYVLHGQEWMDTVSYSVARDESRLLRILGFVFRFGVLVPLGLVGIVLALARGRRKEVTPLLVAGALIAASVAAVLSVYVPVAVNC